MTDSEESKAKEMKKVLIFGGNTGWIGQMMVELAKKEGTCAFCVWPRGGVCFGRSNSMNCHISFRLEAIDR
jgi:hypothetical protein